MNDGGQRTGYGKRVLIVEHDEGERYVLSLLPVGDGGAKPAHSNCSNPG